MSIQTDYQPEIHANKQNASMCIITDRFSAPPMRLQGVRVWQPKAFIEFSVIHVVVNNTMRLGIETLSTFNNNRRSGQCRAWQISTYRRSYVSHTAILQQGVQRDMTPPRYRNAARGGSSHGHRGSAHKLSWRSVQRFQRYARGQTDRQTNWSQYAASLPGSSDKSDSPSVVWA